MGGERFSLQVATGPVQGNGEGFVNDEDFLVRDVDGGRVDGLRGRFYVSDAWYLEGRYEEAELRYGSALRAFHVHTWMSAFGPWH
jgi:hypothetical protein